MKWQPKGVIAAVCVLMPFILTSCDCGGGFDPNCEPKTCSELGRNCGITDDGCGGVLDCGGCPGGLTCGGGGVPGVCGEPGTPCTPRTCEGVGDFCGPLPDGCGGTITCLECAPPESCGGGGVPGVCGVATVAPTCTPASCEEQGLGCGLAGDGCGGTIDCGSCQPGQACGAGGEPSQCGDVPCTPLTCDDLPFECGVAGDGCGGLTESCGSCTPPEICGGGGEPGRCGYAGNVCTEPWCEHLVPCPGAQATTLTGTVYAPNGQIPLSEAMVYVPARPPAPIIDGIECLRCEDQDPDDILVGTVSGSDGSFELRNVPADVEFELVVQIGKWRRTVTISPVDPCTVRELQSHDTRLPRNRSEGHIPRIAVSTGAIDGLECVLLKAGVDESEFTRPSGDGRIHLYRANGAWPDRDLYDSCREYDSVANYCTSESLDNCTSDTCRDALAHNLYADQQTLDGYDMTVFACEYTKRPRSEEVRNRFREHVNHGGRAFLSHWSLDWLWNDSPPYETDPLHSTCDWTSDREGGLDMTANCHPARPPCETEAFVDDSFDRGLEFSEWLDHVNASTASGVLTIYEPRGHCLAVNHPGQQWVYTTELDHGGDTVQQMTFETPLHAPEHEICGRVAYSAFHVSGGMNTIMEYFPRHCQGPLTDQEKVLLFMMFDLAGCIYDRSGHPPWCVPGTCGKLGAECGLIGDGCGDIIDCGPCPEGETCGGGGIPNMCGVALCDPLPCGDNQCGYVADGCGGLVDCGPCPPGLFCGADGAPNECVTGADCPPLTCEDWNADCGVFPDGCGRVMDCGTCPPGDHCIYSGDLAVPGSGAAVCRTLG